MALGTASLCLAQIPSEQVEFFEKKIRPVLAGNCYGCHNSKMKTPMGGLQIDTRDGLLRGGDSGKAIIPGDPAASRLVQAVSYTHELKMPPSGKLTDGQIADLTDWVKMGAPDPRETAAVAPPLISKRYDFTEGRKFWAFQPVKKPAVPAVKSQAWVQSPIDAFPLVEARGERPDTSRAGR